MKQVFPIWLIFAGILFCACSKEQQNTEDCQLPQTIKAETISSHPCNATGKIDVVQPLGNGFLYQLNTNGFQNIPTYTSLKAGKYLMIVKDVNGCTIKDSITLNTIAAGAKFLAVAAILANSCTPCHSGNNPQAGIDFFSPCDILTYWDRIKVRAVDGSSTPMPPQGLLPIQQRASINEWIDAGHGYEN